MKNKEVKNYAVFGSAFNPPTLGHLSVIKQLAHFDKTILVPCYQHVWKKELVEFGKRCEWLHLFIQESRLKNVEISKVEERIVEQNGVTTWALLKHLEIVYPDADLTFIIGPDNLTNFNKFYKSDEIVTRWNILVCHQTIDIRSTYIRENLQKGKSIEGLTTPQLADILNREDFIAN